MTNENKSNSNEIHSNEYDDLGNAHRAHHPPSLDEIQLRAYRVHYQHGGVFGGYSLDDWLEAEHELTEGDDSPDGC